MHILDIAFVNEQERRFRRRGQVIPGLFIDPKMVYWESTAAQGKHKINVVAIKRVWRKRKLGYNNNYKRIRGQAGEGMR